MRIGSAKVLDNGESVTWQCDVDIGDAPPRTLWYSVPVEHRDLLSTRLDAALAALIIPAMGLGEDIALDGPVTDELAHNLNEGRALQRVLRAVNPKLRDIRVDAADPQAASSPQEGVASGFSAGVDSFCVLNDYFLGDVPPGLKLTHLLFNNVGAHRNIKKFRAQYARVQRLSERVGLPVVGVDSNLREFYSESFLSNHTFRNASVPLLLQGGIGRYYYASGRPFAEVGVFETEYIAYSDSLTLSMLSTASMIMKSVGSEYNRVEKTLRVARVPESHRSLDVCIAFDSYEGNCSRCDKCMRTMLTLEIGGLLNRYAAVFDLDTYHRRRTRYMASVLASDGTEPRDVVLFAAARGFTFPIASRMVRFTTPGMRNAARRVARRMS